MFRVSWMEFSAVLAWSCFLLGVVLLGSIAGAAAQTTDTPRCSSVIPEYGGDGTGHRPYEIENVEGLWCMRQDLNAEYRLVSDINASETEEWNNGAGFEPVGGSPALDGTPFNGTLDGAGYNITGLGINRPDENFVGLFGAIGGEGTVTNLTLADVEVRGDTYTGALVGDNRGEITRVLVTGYVNGTEDVGGLVGYNREGKVSGHSTTDVEVMQSTGGGLIGSNEGEVTESSARGNVTSPITAGGLIGFSSRDGTVVESYASGDVEVIESTAGGLVGFNRGLVTKSNTSGDVTSGGRISGGIVGDNRESGVVNESYATGTIKGNEAVGGFVGINYGTVEGLEATNEIGGNESKVEDMDMVGGLVGWNTEGTIRNSSATMDINSSSRSGGLVGRNSEGIIQNSHATGNLP